MLESHRLMPISSPNAVFGYLFGPTMPVVAFALLNLMLFLVFGASVGISFSRMALNQGVILFFAVFIWSLIGLTTFIYRHMFFIGLAAMFLGTCTGLVFYSFVLFPALSLLMTPFLGETIFVNGGGPPSFDATYGEGIAGQMALFALFFAGACRLYRGGYATAFNDRQAVGVLAVWGVLSAAGIFHSDKLGFREMLMGRGEFDQTQGIAQLVASIASCVVVAVIPVWCFLQEQLRKPSKIAPWIFLPIVTLLVDAPAWGAGWLDASNATAHLITFLVAGAQVVTLYALLRMTRSVRFIFAFLIAAALFLAFWIVPLVLELMRAAIMRQSEGEQSMSVLGTFSPLGHLAILWSGEKTVSPVPGLIGQWVAAGITAGIAFLMARRKPASPSQGASATAPAPQSAPSLPPSPPA